MKSLPIILLVLSSACKDGSSTGGDLSRDPSSISEDNETTTGGGSGWAPALSIEEEFTELVNNHRATLGLDPFIHDDRLAVIAKEHSENMASAKVSFGHDGFSKRCDEARQALSGGNWCGENVAAGQSSVQKVFSSWLNSIGHRKNIESSRATHMGLGFQKNVQGKMYWTQLFLEQD